jgi:hypothetical protein
VPPHSPAQSMTRPEKHVRSQPMSRFRPPHTPHASRSVGGCQICIKQDSTTLIAELHAPSLPPHMPAQSTALFEKHLPSQPLWVQRQR